MLIYITSNIVLTLSQGCHAASLSSIKNQQNVEKNGTAKDTQSNSSLKEELGQRDCTEKEKQQQGCLAGTCAALVTSHYHTFIICRCPSDRQGPRCEEVAINTDSIAVILMEQTQELCEQERLCKQKLRS
ncbi:hypothetical protein EB796_009362 [Bugula neritina]|uniref:EGF-like domain-containing protein n=1 Tax=Bugula neritina TaxID=10212 RepID=A0A7J7K2Z8_BUGNE|nr:hypothetical protein EB796_009362 [Bugula neritina]